MVGLVAREGWLISRPNMVIAHSTWWGRQVPFEWWSICMSRCMYEYCGCDEFASVVAWPAQEAPS